MGQTKQDRAREKKHVRSYKDQIDTDAWRAASGSVVKVILAMGMLENGSNNGEIYFSDRIGAEITGLSRNTVRKALNDAMALGFIYCSTPGGFSRKTPHAATYGFTWLAGPKGPNRAPSHAYKHWQNGNTRAQFLTETGPVSEIDAKTGEVTGPDIAPAGLEKRLVSVDSYLSETKPQTVSQGVGAAEVETEQRKRANSYSVALSSLRSALVDHLNGSQPGEQSRLADRLGIPGGTFSKFIGGRNLPDAYRDALAAALKWSEAA